MVSSVIYNYAKALYEITQNKVNTLEQLRTVSEVINTEPIKTFFYSELQTVESKKLSLVAALSKQCSAEVLNSMLLMLDNSRFNHFSEFVLAYESLVDSGHGITRGTVKSAAALDSEARKHIEEVVSRVTGKKVILTYTDENKLVGGVKATVGGWTFEDSVESHILKLKEEINRRVF